jgi:hypothetical protein
LITKSVDEGCRVRFWAGRLQATISTEKGWPRSPETAEKPLIRVIPASDIQLAAHWTKSPHHQASTEMMQQEHKRPIE